MTNHSGHRLDVGEAETLGGGSLLFLEDEHGPARDWCVFSRQRFGRGEGPAVFKLRGTLPAYLSCRGFVEQAYRLVFGREPDGIGGAELTALLESGRVTRPRVLVRLAGSDEAGDQGRQFVLIARPGRWLPDDAQQIEVWRPASPPLPHQPDIQIYPGYEEEDLALLEEFRDPAAKGQPGFVTDFLGGRVRVTSLWQAVRHLDGRVESPPVPHDYHAEAIEWIGLLKSVKSAQERYVAMELGAGFGPWSVSGGLAARRRGIGDIRLYAVEADPQHYRFLRQHFADNGFDPERHVLIEAAVGAAAGVALWPAFADSSNDWGSRPIEMNGTAPDGAPVRDYLGRGFAETIEVRLVAMTDLVTREPRWDLIHIDVQGSEFEIIRAALAELGQRVRWLVVGTHSRKIEGDLIALLIEAGWRLEQEKPAKFAFQPEAASLEAMTFVDGTQVWRNPRW